MADETVLIRCHTCGTRNQIPVARLQDHPRCGRCKTPFPDIRITPQPVVVTDATFEPEILKSPFPVLLDCWASWCGHCGTLAPIMDELARAYAGRLKVAKLNVDQNPLTASQFRVMSLPTLLFFRDGSLVETALGALPKAEIEKYIARLLAA
ncbi:thioredoxin [Desulfosarcina sp. OttesenSCG-928-A07]|nr:thioredoxin [Desulfosarcina sp. OttesenSCG-928-G17]MDL2329771.1 thioredoxin [Desulfosarcina sp. OttesenSCG-928-A07]